MDWTFTREKLSLDTDEWVISALLGLSTFLTFAIERVVWELFDISVEGPQEIVLFLIISLIGVLSLFNGYRGGRIERIRILVAGPVVGMGVFLGGYHLFFTPGSDSPTLLLYLLFVTMVAVVGGVMHLLGVVAGSRN